MDSMRFRFICQQIDDLIVKYIPSHHGLGCAALSSTDESYLIGYVSECTEFTLYSSQRNSFIERLNILSLKFISESLSYHMIRALIDTLNLHEQESTKENIHSFV